MTEHAKSGERTKKGDYWQSTFFVLAPLFARSLISRLSILDDLLEEKRRLLAVKKNLGKTFVVCIANKLFANFVKFVNFKPQLNREKNIMAFMFNHEQKKLFIVCLFIYFFSNYRKHGSGQAGRLK